MEKGSVEITYKNTIKETDLLYSTLVKTKQNNPHKNNKKRKMSQDMYGDKNLWSVVGRNVSSTNFPAYKRCRNKEGTECEGIAN